MGELDVVDKGRGDSVRRARKKWQTRKREGARDGERAWG